MQRCTICNKPIKSGFKCKKCLKLFKDKIRTQKFKAKFKELRNKSQ